MLFKNLLVEFHEKVCIVKINRPEFLNALNEETYKEIHNCFVDLEKNNTIDVILLTGEGRSFVAGADISFMKNLTTKEAKEFGILGTTAFNAVENINKVVIGVINGFALGGGCELAMACDIRFASNRAKFGQPEVTLGITPGSGGTQRLPRLVGLAKAKELIYTGSIIEAEEAEKIGLVNKIIEHDSLMNYAFQIAKKISSNSTTAVQYSKEAINKGTQVDEATSMFIESSLFGLCFSTDDQKEGMNAFLEKRKPIFTNK
ncbi:MAG: enoyl-CoA hydratase-related protein [Fusobacteriaceae bacterium]